MLRVITGSARGRRLQALIGTETMPTSEAVKESVMSSVQFYIEGARVLDLFAGTGQLGIEALSRGAESCLFVESSKEALVVLRDNLKTTQLADKGTVVAGDALTWLSTYDGTFDLVFIDPPYTFGKSALILGYLIKHMAYDGVIMYETSRQEELPQEVDDFYKHKEYTFGKKKVTQYRRKHED